MRKLQVFLNKDQFGCHNLKAFKLLVKSFCAITFSGSRTDRLFKNVTLKFLSPQTERYIEKAFRDLKSTKVVCNSSTKIQLK